MAFVRLPGAWHLPDLVGIQGWRLVGLGPAQTFKCHRATAWSQWGRVATSFGVGGSPGSGSPCPTFDVLPVSLARRGAFDLASLKGLQLESGFAMGSESFLASPRPWLEPGP